MMAFLSRRLIKKPLVEQVGQMIVNFSDGENLSCQFMYQKPSPAKWIFPSRTGDFLRGNSFQTKLFKLHLKRPIS
jgi:hypothetical protein